MARVGPRWRHRGILHRPGRVRWHRKEWCDSQHWQGGWASSESSHSRVGPWAMRAVCSRPAP